eukprot:6012500-Amphidinium_carterae.5
MRSTFSNSEQHSTSTHLDHPQHQMRTPSQHQRESKKTKKKNAQQARQQSEGSQSNRKCCRGDVTGDSVRPCAVEGCSHHACGIHRDWVAVTLSGSHGTRHCHDQPVCCTCKSDMTMSNSVKGKIDSACSFNVKIQIAFTCLHATCKWEESRAAQSSDNDWSQSDKQLVVNHYYSNK